MIVGRPDLQQKTIFANITHPVGENAKFYMTHGYSERWNRSFAYYRFPGWRRDVADAGFLTPNAEDFVGYHPTFEGDIKDFFNVVGVDLALANGWNLDLSVTHGKNSIFYTVNRSVNRDYLADNGWSPTTFKPGGYAFSNSIQNAALTKSCSDQVSFSAGWNIKLKSLKHSLVTLSLVMEVEAFICWNFP